METKTHELPFPLMGYPIVPIWAILVLAILAASACSRPPLRWHAAYVGEGYAETQVNTVIFRKNALISQAGTQYIAYYDSSGTVILGKRRLGQDDWTLQKTPFRGNVQDAHNSISLMADGDGYLHMAWDHHGDPLRYARSKAPGSLELELLPAMVGTHEQRVTYPEFYRLPGGDLLFLYRDGSSGNGNLVLNRYLKTEQRWIRLHDNLIDGEGQRNAYWQCAIGPDGTLHLAWVWRETGDVATNHDMAYARSSDFGATWTDVDGTPYFLPIKEHTARYAMRIPQGSNLINQTSLAADVQGRPYIATYFKRPLDDCTQFFLIYRSGREWRHSTIGARSLDFTLGGYGTRSPPISRPVVLVEPDRRKPSIHVLYRDEEHGNRVCLSSARGGEDPDWQHRHLTAYGMDRWEPVYDTGLWESDSELHIFLQRVGQGSGERPVPMLPTPIFVLEISTR